MNKKTSVCELCIWNKSYTELRKWNQMKDDPGSCERSLSNYVKKPEKN